MEQNLCPNCSKPVLDTEEICPNCGAIIGARQARPLTKRAIKSKPQNMMAASPKNRLIGSSPAWTIAKLALPTAPAMETARLRTGKPDKKLAPVIAA